jgi:pre-rRNA-processing protein TSR3
MPKSNAFAGKSDHAMSIAPQDHSETNPVPPRTIIVIHPRERRSKCSVEPLRENPEYLFVTFPKPVPIDLSTYVRLGIGGPLLSKNDSQSGLLLLDGTWKRAAQMLPFYQHLPVRSLPPVRTAYPRRSEIFEDPSEGLATIEALYAALKTLGRPHNTLLDHYYWREEFLRINGWQ